MRYIYVLAIDNPQREIRFESVVVDAIDENGAYAAGQRHAEAYGWLPIRAPEWGNDYVIAVVDRVPAHPINVTIEGRDDERRFGVAARTTDRRAPKQPIVEVQLDMSGGVALATMTINEVDAAIDALRNARWAAIRGHASYRWLSHKTRVERDGIQHSTLASENATAIVTAGRRRRSNVRRER